MAINFYDKQVRTLARQSDTMLVNGTQFNQTLNIEQGGRKHPSHLHASHSFPDGGGKSFPAQY